MKLSQSQSQYRCISRLSINDLVGKKVMIFDTETTDLPLRCRCGWDKYYDYRENKAYDSARILSIA